MAVNELHQIVGEKGRALAQGTVIRRPFTMITPGAVARSK